MKKFTRVLIMLLLFVGVSLNGQDMVITGVIDGPLTGGVPKAVELYVINDIADASIYGLESANNGGGTVGEEFTFPTVSYSSGDFIYIASEDVGFFDWFGFSPDYVDGVSNINGDDAIVLFMNASIIDVFGDVDVDGTGEPWEYLDGWAYRVSGTGPDGNTFVLANFTYSGTNALDEETTNATAAIPFPTATYTFSASTTVATPIISPSSGDYFAPIDVSMTCSTDGASIYYTTDGSDPDESSTLYSSSFSVSTETTVKARAYKTDMTESNIATSIYTFPSVTDISTIAILRTQTVGDDYYQLTGEAILTFQQSFRNQKFIQDATAAILIDDEGNAITSTYNIYDGITGIVGKLSEYGGMLQFVPNDDPGSASSTGNTITPEVVSLSQLTSNFEDYEAKVVKVESVVFADAGATFAVGTEYVITDEGSVTYDFRTTFYDVDYIDAVIPSGPQDLVLIPHSRTDGEFVASRSSADINPASGGSSAVKLDITVVNNGQVVYDGQPFSLKVEAQDVSGTAADVDTDVNVTLTIGTGTGTLGGTLTGTITSGTNSVTISGVTYTPFESGVVLNVSDDASNLTTGNSDAFDVLEVIIPAVKLDITTINSGQAVYDGQPFSITVQAQDADGNSAGVDTDVDVTLSVGTGTGTLGGTLTGTIASGTSSVTISGTTYTPFETGVILNVSDDASNLTAGNSDAFDVLEVVLLAPPTNLVAEVGPFDDVQLTWDAPDLNGIEDDFESSINTRNINADLLGYNVYRDDVQINDEVVVLTEYNDPEPSIASHDYYVTAVYDGGESEPSNVVTVVVTDVNEISINSVDIYPNPTDKMFTIGNPDNLIIEVSLLTIAGQEVYHSSISETSQINVSDLQKGIYVVHLLNKSSNNMLIKKLIVR